MHNTYRNMTSISIIKEISSRIKEYRIDYPMTQKELAEKSGVSVRSLSRFENGEDIQLGNLIRILQALDLQENLDLLVPDYKKRPSFYLKEEKVRYRARRKTNKDTDDFKWGDEK